MSFWALPKTIYPKVTREKKDRQHLFLEKQVYLFECSYAQIQTPSLKMGFFPLPHRPRSFEGPHMTCMQTFETYASRFKKRSADTRFDFLMERSILFGHIRFLILFSSGLFTMTAFLSICMIYLFGYAALAVFLRFQYKLEIFLLMLGRRPIHFFGLITLWAFSLRIALFLVGGFGWIFLLFIET